MSASSSATATRRACSAMSVPWQGQNDLGARRPVFADLQAPAMSLDDPSCNRHAESAAVRLGGVERLEHPQALLVVQAEAVVAQLHAQRRAAGQLDLVAGDLDAHRAGAGLERVLQQDAEELAEAEGVGAAPQVGRPRSLAQ